VHPTGFAVTAGSPWRGVCLSRAAESSLWWDSAWSEGRRAGVQPRQAQQREHLNFWGAELNHLRGGLVLRVSCVDSGAPVRGRSPADRSTKRAKRDTGTEE
jgi:hypothetical protein